ncbi:MAG: GNAT family N-acetyltransferase [Parabacteroides sp.]|nr:GNAT family N-acetyltransferase [Parabacteroides sp.]
MRRWKESDAETLFKYASDPDVGPRAGWPVHQSVEESREVIRKFFLNDSTWAIVLNETEEPIGCIGYFTHDKSNIPIGEQDCEIGYWVGKPYWNQGICTEALQLMLDYCVNVMHFGQIWLDYFTGNSASGRVMEKCGFQDTGKLHPCSHLVGGDKELVKIMRFDKEGQALQLALRVFMEFEAPDYPESML